MPDDPRHDALRIEELNFLAAFMQSRLDAGADPYIALETMASALGQATVQLSAIPPEAALEVICRRVRSAGRIYVSLSPAEKARLERKRFHA